MTRIVATRQGYRVVVIEPEPPDVCETCGTVAELRPYGPGGARICFDCGMQDEAGTKRRFNLVAFGEGEG